METRPVETPLVKVRVVEARTVAARTVAARSVAFRLVADRNRREPAGPRPRCAGVNDRLDRAPEGLGLRHVNRGSVTP